ncbi:MAG TPA: GDSL-type esterase/lipase family protein [Armatimonadota bacterium]|nr:GDSL-type esterase/lipase family protein [Armatimonadota bacterium]
MKEWIMLGIVLLGAAGAATDAEAARGERLRFYGRWDRRTAGRAVTVNSGSHVVARFRGTGIVARFDVSANRPPFPTLAWRVDEGEWQEAEVAPTVTLAAGLREAPHTLTLMVRDLDEHQSRWSPPLVASVTFLGLDVTGGKLLAPPPAPKLKLEFLGDSITEGVLVHPVRPGMETWPWRGDGRLAYSAQTAMRLGAQWRQVGFGRLGVTIEGNGGVPVAPDSFNWFFAGSPRDNWQPHAVIVNQGTNDGRTAREVFRPAYARYLQVIREAYPKARIFAVRPFIGSHAEDIQAEVAARQAGGDRKVVYVDTTGWLTREDYTDGVHPNPQGGAKAADRMAEVLRTHLRLRSTRGDDGG